MSSVVNINQNTHNNLQFKSSSPSKQQKQRLSKLMAINSINHRPTSNHSTTKAHKSFHSDDLENKHDFVKPTSNLHNLTLQSNHLNRYANNNSNNKKRNTQQQRKTLNEKTNQNDTTLLFNSNNNSITTTNIQKTITSNRNNINLEDTPTKKSNNICSQSITNNSFLKILQNNSNEYKNNNDLNETNIKNNDKNDQHASSMEHVLVPKWRVNVIKASYRLEGTEV